MDPLKIHFFLFNKSNVIKCTFCAEGYQPPHGKLPPPPLLNRVSSPLGMKMFSPAPKKHIPLPWKWKFSDWPPPNSRGFPDFGLERSIRQFPNSHDGQAD